jgi:diketogulonate reductase-like aldo/keto reductase
MKYLTMNNGLKIPVLGTGTNTFGKENRDYFAPITFDTTELRSAISLGYRLIDTAIYYRNEVVIGKAVKESNIDRKEFFIVSKIPEKKENISNDIAVRRSMNQSLFDLDVTYIDLYLMHFPLEKNEDNVRVWRVLETYVDAGLLKSIGVCNFNIEQLTYLLEHARIKPVLHQFQSYPGHHQQHLIDFCKKHNIIPQAYHSIAKTSDEDKELLSAIGNKYNKSWSQVTLNYQISQGMVVIPKSHNPENQRSNIDVFDFELSDEDKEIIKYLKKELVQ